MATRPPPPISSPPTRARTLQARFGNAGHGFILPAKPWAWYQHAGVRVNGSGWQMVPASHFEAHDGLFGLGGVVSPAALPPRAKSNLRRPLTRDSKSGSCANPKAVFWTSPPMTFRSAASIPRAIPRAPISPHSKRLRRFHIGLARHPGPCPPVWCQRRNSGAGLVYDSLGLNGASITVLSRIFNQSHWVAELQHRHPALVIVNYGTNEADFPDFIDQQYEKELHEAIRRLRARCPTPRS